MGQPIATQVHDAQPGQLADLGRQMAQLIVPEGQNGQLMAGAQFGRQFLQQVLFQQERVELPQKSNGSWQFGQSILSGLGEKNKRISRRRTKPRSGRACRGLPEALPAGPDGQSIRAD